MSTLPPTTDNPFDSERLWNKSKAFARYAIVARNEESFELAHLWFSLSAELLGKSVLATTHPALVADPTQFDSLMVAFGLRSANSRSITAKTTYLRLQSVVRDFDEKHKNFALTLADRRNEELHSGNSPMAHVSLESWLPMFWRMVNVLVRARENSLEDWVGASEAERATAIIEDAANTVAETIRARVAHHGEEFNRAFPKDSDLQKLLFKSLESQLGPVGCEAFVGMYDGHSKTRCPACGAIAWVFGHEWDRRDVEIDTDGVDVWGAYQWVEYTAEALACGACDLVLSGQNEIEAAGVDDSFQVQEEYEPDFDDLYMNE